MVLRNGRPLSESLPSVTVHTGAEILAIEVLNTLLIASAVVTVYHGERIMFAGPPGAGKTWLALIALVEALAKGLRVLLLLGEGSLSALRVRLEMVAHAVGVARELVEERLTVIHGAFPLTDASAAEALQDLNASLRADVVVIDPFPHFMSGDENAARDVIDLNMAIDHVFGTATKILVHHTAKPREGISLSPRGSSAIVGWLDALFVVSRLGRQGVRVTNTKRRDYAVCPERTVDLGITEGSLTIMPSDIEEARPAERTPRLQTRILDAIGTAGARKSEIRAAVNRGGSALAQALDELVANGLVLREGEGSAAVYRRS